MRHPTTEPHSRIRRGLRFAAAHGLITHGSESHTLDGPLWPLSSPVYSTLSPSSAPAPRSACSPAPLRATLPPHAASGWGGHWTSSTYRLLPDQLPEGRLRHSAPSLQWGGMTGTWRVSTTSWTDWTPRDHSRPRCTSPSTAAVTPHHHLQQL